MKDRERIDYARREVEDIRRALLDAAAFGKTLTPLSLERMADRLTATMQSTRTQPPPAPERADRDASPTGARLAGPQSQPDHIGSFCIESVFDDDLRPSTGSVSVMAKRYL